ncbi:class I SAM-dependent methyltransferase [Sphaerochaeta sp. PS]|uniref:class I SAM-dependent methyltransferase n=1 Tax=Sphaerochaeta sp. PS TaxID=3076336 RepID=UPI0028A42BBD|nr:class I SAM-dependent methyltransferase [Sphaerochaeta sp. PS]MDT4761605.1 class I SAM-dependent methyltransferase [Sphaerochaeta sp. PS]
MEKYTTYNEQAWDFEVGRGNMWTDGCTAEQILEARKGNLMMSLSPFKQVPHSWIAETKGKEVLCLACGGGQQGILLASYGAKVTVFDISSEQLKQDATIAKREGLTIAIEHGDMSDLSRFSDQRFDLIFNPTSTCFIDDVQKVYHQCNRILKDGGTLLTSATNPALYMFDEKAAVRGKMKVKYTIPFSDLKSLSEKELLKRLKKHDTIEFSHTINDLVGGLCKQGFSIIDLYTDTSGCLMMDSFVHDCYMAIRAKKGSKGSC